MSGKIRLPTDDEQRHPVSEYCSCGHCLIAAAVLAERESCAGIEQQLPNPFGIGNREANAYSLARADYARYIRARGEGEGK